MSTHEQDPPAPARVELEGTDGIAIKQLVPEDAQAYFDLVDFDRQHLSQHGDITARNYQTVDDVLRSIEDPDPANIDKLRFGIWDGGAMVGSINLTPKRPGVSEVGYWVGAQHVGHGYAGRATRTLVGYGFNQLGLNEITAWVDPQNLASQKTLEKAGFKKVADGQDIRYQLSKDEHLDA